MSNAGSRTPEEYIRNTVRRLGRGRILLVGVLGALVVLGVGVISAAALVGLPTIPTSTTSLTTGDPAEKAFVERFPEGKSQYLSPIFSLIDPNSRNIGRNSLPI